MLLGPRAYVDWRGEKEKWHGLGRGFIGGVNSHGHQRHHSIRNPTSPRKYLNDWGDNAARLPLPLKPYVRVCGECADSGWCPLFGVEASPVFKVQWKPLLPKRELSSLPGQKRCRAALLGQKVFPWRRTKRKSRLGPPCQQVHPGAAEGARGHAHTQWH